MSLLQCSEYTGHLSTLVWLSTNWERDPAMGQSGCALSEWAAHPAPETQCCATVCNRAPQQSPLNPWFSYWKESARDSAVVLQSGCVCIVHWICTTVCKLAVTMETHNNPYHFLHVSAGEISSPIPSHRFGEVAWAHFPGGHHPGSVMLLLHLKCF